MRERYHAKKMTQNGGELPKVVISSFQQGELPRFAQFVCQPAAIHATNKKPKDDKIKVLTEKK